VCFVPFDLYIAPSGRSSFEGPGAERQRFVVVLALFEALDIGAVIFAFLVV